MNNHGSKIDLAPLHAPWSQALTHKADKVPANWERQWLHPVSTCREIDHVHFRQHAGWDICSTRKCADVVLGVRGLRVSRQPPRRRPSNSCRLYQSKPGDLWGRGDRIEEIFQQPSKTSMGTCAAASCDGRGAACLLRGCGLGLQAFKHAAARTFDGLDMPDLQPP